MQVTKVSRWRVMNGKGRLDNVEDYMKGDDQDGSII